MKHKLLTFILRVLESWCEGIKKRLNKKSGKAIAMSGFFKVQSVDKGER